MVMWYELIFGVLVTLVSMQMRTGNVRSKSVAHVCVCLSVRMLIEHTCYLSFQTYCSVLVTE